MLHSRQTATKLDETSVIALSGIIACQIHDGQFDVSKMKPVIWRSSRSIDNHSCLRHECMNKYVADIFQVAKEQLDFLKEIQSTVNVGTTGGSNFVGSNNKSEILYMRYYDALNDRMIDKAT